jgi:predicted  nucleic acid-binding Zn-ribbon protein
MDQDLKEYLDQRFSSIDRRLEETGQQIQDLRGETSDRFQETGQQIQALRGETSDRFGETGQQIQALREETNQRFGQLEDRLETEVRGVHIAVEGLRGEIRLVADGVANANERLDRYQDKVSQELADIKTFNQLSYKDLRRSQTDLEARVRK